MLDAMRLFCCISAAVCFGVGLDASTAQAAAGSGCGLGGPTRSDEQPSAFIGVPALAVQGDRVRLVVADATQTAGAVVSLFSERGVPIARTPEGQYACTEAGVSSSALVVPLTDEGRRQLKSFGSVWARGTVKLTNGSGRQRTLFVSPVIVDDRLLAKSPTGRCRPGVAAPTSVRRGGALGLVVRVCSPGRVRVAFIATDGANRGKRVLRRTLTVARKRHTPAVLTIGAVSAGRYRLALIADNGRVIARQRRVEVTRP